MTREEFIKQRCEIDKITLEEFEEQYRIVECNCVCASKIVNYNEFQNDIAWLECHKNEKIF